MASTGARCMGYRRGARSAGRGRDPGHKALKHLGGGVDMRAGITAAITFILSGAPSRVVSMKWLPRARFSLVLLGLLSAAGPAAAQDFRRGLSAFNRGEYEETLRQWLPLARRADADAQAGLGYLYFKGLGVQQDYAEAAIWFGRAAEKGQPEAQLFLGFLSYSGEGVTQSYVLAYKWCELAQSNGASEALPCREAAELHMTPAELAESERLVDDWFARHQHPAP
jgi:TPR repeat protein